MGINFNWLVRFFVFLFFFFYLGSGSWKTAQNSFLYSLVNPSGLSPTKMPLKSGQEGSAMYCNSGYGPTYGAGHDLYIFNAPNSNNCSTYLNNTYQCPLGQNNYTFLTGSQTFRVSEMEVYRL